LTRFNPKLQTNKIYNDRQDLIQNWRQKISSVQNKIIGLNGLQKGI
jgi:hypothetical protein